MDPDRKKKLIYGGITATVVLVIVVVSIVVFTRPHSQCIPSIDRPDIYTLEVKNLFSEQGPVVANMAGYVELLSPSGKTYLPLDFNSVRISKPDYEVAQVVSLEGQCISVKVAYHNANSSSGSYYMYNYIEMLVKNDAKQDKSAKKICEFNEKFNFNQESTSRFSCKNELKHKCSMDDDLVALLVLKSFELELDADLDHAKRHEFSKQPSQYSCSLWDH